MERTGDEEWRVGVHDRRGELRNTCTVRGRKSECAVPRVK
jgi:hypothetical protein